MAYLTLKNINKIYPNGYHAVHNFNLEIEKGEFVVFVGPSGCGKSTTLRMIAGLEDISNGEFLINGKRANEMGPREREVAMVFQSYALYPQMTVYDNIAFGLTLQGVDEDVIEERVKNIAGILGLTDYLDRLPRALSGGQRQRVAIGRAIIRKVGVFLMDEPLSNLDAKQRVTMRYEIAQIHQETGATTIYVTHDQTEAMTLADRIVVMKDGYVQQIGTPYELYFKPAERVRGGLHRRAAHELRPRHGAERQDALRPGGARPEQEAEGHRQVGGQGAGLRLPPRGHRAGRAGECLSDHLQRGADRNAGRQHQRVYHRGQGSGHPEGGQPRHPLFDGETEKVIDCK